MKKILLLEDDESLNRGISLKLSKEGYPVFLWAKDNVIFNISHYHYPVRATIVVVLVLLSVQFVLTSMLQKAQLIPQNTVDCILHLV